VFVFNFIFSRLVSLYNLAYQQYRRHKTNGLLWPQLWVICDCKDKNHTAYLSASFRSLKQSSLQSSFIGNKYGNGGLQPDEKDNTEDDRYIAAGYVITMRGSIFHFIFIWFGLLLNDQKNWLFDKQSNLE